MLLAVTLVFWEVKEGEMGYMLGTGLEGMPLIYCHYVP